jgi:hypothetical protein
VEDVLSIRLTILLKRCRCFFAIKSLRHYNLFAVISFFKIYLNAVFLIKYFMISVIAKKNIVITNCTGRKRIGFETLRLSVLHAGGVPRDVASAWVKHLEGWGCRVVAGDFYVGRSFLNAQKTSEDLNAPFLILSAGLGLISSRDLIPAYDLTVSSGDNNVLKRLDSTSYKSSDWWQALNSELGNANPLKSLIDRSPNTNFFIALPSTYLEMVAPELNDLSTDQISKLRIFTSELGRASLSDCLLKQVIPYDDRLESTQFAGTRNDFPQRALRHFVSELNADGLALDEAKTLVLECMSLLKKRSAPRRKKKSDEEICTLLNLHWGICGGKSNALLRYLRDEKDVACEQSRFRRLWSIVHNEKMSLKVIHD